MLVTSDLFCASLTVWYHHTIVISPFCMVEGAYHPYKRTVSIHVAEIVSYGIGIACVVPLTNTNSIVQVVVHYGGGTIPHHLGVPPFHTIRF
jgi:hypothetical protein